MIQHINIVKRLMKYYDENLKVVAVSELETKSKILFFADLNENPNTWPNTSIGEYYNKQIYLIKDR